MSFLVSSNLVNQRQEDDEELCKQHTMYSNSRNENTKVSFLQQQQQQQPQQTHYGTSVLNLESFDLDKHLDMNRYAIITDLNLTRQQREQEEQHASYDYDDEEVRLFSCFYCSTVVCLKKHQ